MDRDDCKIEDLQVDYEFCTEEESLYASYELSNEILATNNKVYNLGLESRQN